MEAIALYDIIRLTDRSGKKIDYAVTLCSPYGIEIRTVLAKHETEDDKSIHSIEFIWKNRDENEEKQRSDYRSKF